MNESQRDERTRVDEKLTRRGMLLSLGCAAVALSPIVGAAGKPRLHVFANTDVRAQAFEKELESHMPGVDVTVFGRIRGFQQASGDNPEAMLALKPVLDSLGLTIDLQGHRDGKPTEQYVLVANARSVSPSDLSGDDKLGVVDIMGRRRMPGFVTSVLGVETPRLAYVTHERDLLSLLRLGAATAVLTSKRWADLLKGTSQMDLRMTPLATEVGLPAISYRSTIAQSAIEQALKSSNSVNGKLGVNQWR